MPDTLEDRNQLAYDLVPKAMNQVFGPQDEGWHSFKNEERNFKTYVKLGRNPVRR